TVRIAGHEATISNWLWTSESKPLERMLNGMLHSGAIYRSVADGNSDLRAAEYVVDQLGGEILAWTDWNDEHARTY
ncbi:MAG: hypothetical protein K0Q72_4368, partial [Armatimonadetes bacterium]|nr:hypothetical protein [Armatimonadota bacterium]